MKFYELSKKAQNVVIKNARLVFNDGIDSYYEGSIPKHQIKDAFTDRVVANIFNYLDYCYSAEPSTNTLESIGEEIGVWRLWKGYAISM